MFYFLFAPYLMYSGALIAAAVIPAIFLMVKVYRSDKLEKESPFILWKLVKAGFFATLLAIVEESVLSYVLNMFVSVESPLYNIIMFMIIVAFAEETSKYIFMKRETWRNPEFNCLFDGVVYATFTSLGFALFENISYVLASGFGTAAIRAITAIPGHACFGVFMGVFYGLAKKYDYAGNAGASKILRVFSILVPAFLHGTYDYIASSEAENGFLYFLAFVIALFIVTYILIGKASRNDRLIAPRGPFGL